MLWLRRLLRMSVIGLGASLVAGAVVNMVAIDRLFDASVEHQLGITRAEMRHFYYALGGVGLALIGVGALIPARWLGAGSGSAKVKPARRPAGPRR